jgi:hypothetical protein
MLLAACGGGGSGSSGTSSPPPPPLQNTLTVTVNGGPSGLGNQLAVDIPYVTVTVCLPGTTQCQTIDHIQVDTGSSGFRVISSLLPSTFTLPAQTSGGLPVQECLPFADGFVWGPVVTADLKIGNETAASVPIQIMGGSAFAVPSDCKSNLMGGMEEDTVAQFGANGILGVSSFIQDCGQACVQAVLPGSYYTCTSTACTGIKQPAAMQITNPVALFASDNNGVLLQLPSIGSAGAATATGTLIFGIDTQSNNGISNGATVLMADAYDSITTTYNGQAYDQSYIDSGSNGYFFNDSTIALCPSSGAAPGFFCPTSTLSLSATNQGTTGPSSTVSFQIGNADTLLEGTAPISALNNIGAPASGTPNTFDWGLPFFFGRKVYFAIEGRTTSRGMGPFYAY